MTGPSKAFGTSPTTRRFFIGFGLLLMMVGGYGLWWHHMAGSLRADLDHWITGQTAAGWKISTGEVAVGGFPTRFVLSLPSPGVEDPSGDAWQGPPLEITTRLFDPQHPHLSVPGSHAIRLNGHAAATIAAEDASADLVIDFQGFHQARIALAKVSAGSVHLGRLDIDLQRLVAGSVDHTQASWGLQVSLGDLGLPDDPRLLFGSSIPSAHLETRLLGSLAGSPLLPALEAWREDGGTIEIDALSVDWPPLAVSGKGTLALDRDLQPMLASSCNVRGLFKAIDVLVRSGTVRPQDAGMVKLAFGLLMKTDRDGGQSLSVPVTVQNRVLSVGPVKLFDMPALEWRRSF